MNTFGRIYRVTTFGESHGVAIGGVIDGVPSGIKISVDEIQRSLDLRKPGKNKYVSKRAEPDKIEILSGMLDDTTTGMPIGFIIRNVDADKSSYNNLADLFRPSHADFSYFAKYGLFDYKGGGRASARETAARIVAGSIATQALRLKNIEILSYLSQVGGIKIPKCPIDKKIISNSEIFCPDKKTENKIKKLIETTIAEEDSIGGAVSVSIQGMFAGIGEPIFDKLSARLACAMMSIPGAKGFELGSGFRCIEMKGSEHNDPFIFKKGKIVTSKNDSGGINAGISNGNEVYFRVAFKPTSSIAKVQQSVTRQGESINFSIKGRHDPCIAIRAVPVVEAMTAITLFDLILHERLSRW